MLNPKQHEVVTGNGMLKKVSSREREFQKKAIRKIVWSSMLDYNPFGMDRHLVRALIDCWNLDLRSFKASGR